MRSLSLLLCMFLCFASCNDNNNLSAENDRLKKENDSLKKSSAQKVIIPHEPDKIDTVHVPPAIIENTIRGGVHPISLHWISWDKKGKATLTPLEDGWYTISGSQLNENREYLNIDGKIRRLSEKELEFEGTIETRIQTNNGGEPCIKKGTQRFFGKGSRTYFRLQNMENCQGGNLVDYVDIYPGTSSL